MNCSNGRGVGEYVTTKGNADGNGNSGQLYVQRFGAGAEHRDDVADLDWIRDLGLCRNGRNQLWSQRNPAHIGGYLHCDSYGGSRRQQQC